MFDKLLNLYASLKERLRMLRRNPPTAIDRHGKSTQLADDVAEQLSELKTLRAELKGEIAVELGFSFHDFGRGFAEYVNSLSGDQVQPYNVVYRLGNIERAQTDLKGLFSETTAGLDSRFEEIAKRLVATESMQSELRGLLGEATSSVSERFDQANAGLNNRLKKLEEGIIATKDAQAELRALIREMTTRLNNRFEKSETWQVESRDQLARLYSSLHARLDTLASIQLETRNLTSHVNTSVHTRLDTIENVRFNGLDEQMHELTARQFEQSAIVSGDRSGWVQQAEERYEPAKHLSFEDCLARASKEFPQIYPLWTERLAATQRAFRDTKVGNAAHAGDPSSRIFRSIVERYAIGRVLDVGCGVFGRPYYLSSYPAELISGIDPLAPVELPDFEFIHGISEYLPWPDGSFSTVISATSLDHSLSLDRSLAEIRRVLRPGGRILLWIASVPGSPAYQPDDHSFKPADQFHLFHFDIAWLEPMIDQWGEIMDRIELRRSGFSEVMYCLLLRPPPRLGLNKGEDRSS